MASQVHQQDLNGNMSSPYPLDPSSYRLLQKIGNGVSATVYKAACLPMNSSIVAIKAIDLERSRANLDDVRREAKAMTLLSHPNILRAHCSFTVNHYLWVVMPFMSAGSLHSIISSSFPDGLTESSIAVVLKEILNALLYLHDQGHLHRDIKAGNILVDSDGSVKLADFGVSALIYEPNSSHASSVSSSLNFMLNEVAGTPYWMAPEVIHSHVGYSFKADIWSFGITALELAHGRPPLSHLPPWKSLFMRITNRLRPCDFEKSKKDKKKFSKSFRDMVAVCLATDPLKRPTAGKLLKHPFFKNCKNVDFLVKNMLQGLPTVEERYYKESLKCQNQDDENDDDDEGLVRAADEADQPVEKHRRISGWNFNEEVFELVPVFPTERSPESIQTNHTIKDQEKERRRLTESSSFRFWEGEIIPKEDHDEDDRADQQRSTVSESTHEMMMSLEERCPLINNNCGGKGGMVPLMVPKLIALMESLEDERQVVSNLIARIKGQRVDDQVMSHEVQQLQQTIAQLSLQLEQERRRSELLEMELELVRRKNTDFINTDDSSENGVSEKGGTGPEPNITTE